MVFWKGSWIKDISAKTGNSNQICTLVKNNIIDVSVLVLIKVLWLGMMLPFDGKLDESFCTILTTFTVNLVIIKKLYF